MASQKSEDALAIIDAHFADVVGHVGGCLRLYVMGGRRRRGLLRLLTAIAVRPLVYYASRHDSPLVNIIGFDVVAALHERGTISSRLLSPANQLRSIDGLSFSPRCHHTARWQSSGRYAHQR